MSESGNRMRSLDLAPGLSVPPEAVTETFAILANRGSGKSATARRLVEQMHQAGLPVAVLDVKGDWWGIRSSADGKTAGLPFVIFGGDHGDVPLEPTAGELLADLIVDDRVAAIIDLSHMSKAKARTFATSFAERLYLRNRDPLHLVIEEADVLVPQRASADTARLLGAMEDIAKRGRHRGIGLTLVTQRGQETAKSVLEMIETVILMRMTGPRSIKAAQDWISVNADANDTQASTVIGSLPALETGEAWVWSPAFLRVLKRVRISKFETFDSHVTPSPGRGRIVPKGRADIDLEELGAEIAATVRRAKDNDPTALRSSIDELSQELDNARRREQVLAEGRAEHQRVLTEKAAEIAELKRRVAELQRLRPAEVIIETLETAAGAIRQVIGLLDHGDPGQGRDEQQAGKGLRSPHVGDETRPLPSVKSLTPPRAAVVATPAAKAKFRPGAQRMLESLGRMAPLRLTKSQWGTVACMKHTSGTWSTYLGELRRAGLIDENRDGFTLSDSGFEYLGGRPDPMTGSELQHHYLSILRAGAARMLQAVMNAYPHGLTRDEIGTAAQISVTSGTFSTYLGELRRNGLVDQRGQIFIASDVLMLGAERAAG